MVVVIGPDDVEPLALSRMRRRLHERRHISIGRLLGQRLDRRGQLGHHGRQLGRRDGIDVALLPHGVAEDAREITGARHEIGHAVPRPDAGEGQQRRRMAVGIARRISLRPVRAGHCRLNGGRRGLRHRRRGKDQDGQQARGLHGKFPFDRDPGTLHHAAPADKPAGQAPPTLVRWR